jgi:hypothetical protein
VRQGPREGLEVLCPFCRSKLDRPARMVINAMDSVLGGTCSCGAIYIADTTGKNVGEVMIQALGLAAEKLSKDMSELVAGEDYEDAILSYDWRIHRSPGVSKGYMDGYGRMYVLKVKRKPS